MIERYFIIVNADLQERQCVTVTFEDDDPAAADPVTAIDGYAAEDGWVIRRETQWQPTEFEDVANDGTMTENVVRREDTRAGKDHIKEVRMMKTLEATMILSGVALDKGFLAEEAAARSVPLSQLAQQVYDQSQNFRDKELARRQAKLGNNW